MRAIRISRSTTSGSTAGGAISTAIGAQLCEDRKVGELAVDRSVVELEVTGVDDDPGRRPEGDPHRVRDGVSDPERDDTVASALDAWLGQAIAVGQALKPK